MGPKRSASDETGNVRKRQRKVQALWEKVKACGRIQALWDKVKVCGGHRKGKSAAGVAHSVRTSFQPISSSSTFHSGRNRYPLKSEY